MVAALSANHLAALVLPKGLRRLYVAHDNDEAGLAAAETLVARTFDSDLDVRLLPPEGDDWNADVLLFPRTARLATLSQFTLHDRG